MELRSDQMKWNGLQVEQPPLKSNRAALLPTATWCITNLNYCITTWCTTNFCILDSLQQCRNKILRIIYFCVILVQLIVVTLKFYKL